jgi:hypothetical protein
MFDLSLRNIVHEGRSAFVKVRVVHAVANVL